MTEATTPQNLADVGVIGMAVMGSSLARNMAHKGYTVAVFNRTYSRTQEMVAAHGSEGKFIASERLEDFVASLERPRRVVIMVAAGAGTDAVIKELTGLLDEGDIIVDAAGMKGTGTWTVQSALKLAVPVNAISEAVFARAISSSPELRAHAQAALPGPDQRLEVDDREAFIDAIRQALWASKVVAYAQGLDEIRIAAKTYGWDIDVAAVAKIWRAGCIIRAKLLDRISNEYAANNLVTLLEAPSIVEGLGNSQDAWRRVISTAVTAGVPVPGFSAALAYYDQTRAPRLNAALTQGLRDFFGAHTYARTDREGVFHTLWSGDRSEVTGDGFGH